MNKCKLGKGKCNTVNKCNCVIHINDKNLGGNLMEYVLKTTELTKVYQKKQAVSKVSMNIKRGDIYGFIGKNGAGKTTLIRLVLGLASPNHGDFELFESKNLLASRKKIGNVIETPSTYANMTAFQNLEAQRIMLGITDKSIVNKIIDIVGLNDAGKKKSKNFSLGMKQRLGIGLALLDEPEFLILDEPINGLDPTGIKDVRDLILKLNKEQGITILISSHILGELSKMATCYGIINNGILVDEFSSEELAKRCKQSLVIKVDDTNKAIELLKTDFNITNIELIDNNSIRIFEAFDKTGSINTALVKNDVAVSDMSVVGQDLEDYFMELMGDFKNV